MLLKLLMLECEPLSKKPAYADSHYLEVLRRNDPEGHANVESSCKLLKLGHDVEKRGTAFYIGTGNDVFNLEDVVSYI